MLELLLLMLLLRADQIFLGDIGKLCIFWFFHVVVNVIRLIALTGLVLFFGNLLGVQLPGRKSRLIGLSNSFLVLDVEGGARILLSQGEGAGGQWEQVL